jgi:APA family basic amino acid/polyamine antiporter
MVFAVLFSVNLLIYKPQYTWPGLFIVLLGIPVYYYVETCEQATDTDPA